MATRGSQPMSAATVSAEVMAMEASSSGSGFTHTAASPKPKSGPSAPSQPGMLKMPRLEMVSTPSARPTMVMPPRMTSPVEQSMPPKVMSVSPRRCIMRARSIGFFARRRMAFVLKGQSGMASKRWANASFASASVTSTIVAPASDTPASSAADAIAAASPTRKHSARFPATSSATVWQILGLSPSKKATFCGLAAARSRNCSIRSMRTPLDQNLAQ